MNGYQVTKYIRSKSHLQDVPIILMSSYDGVGERLKAYVAGVTTYLPKPFTGETILKIVQKDTPVIIVGK
jgi:CheY-like chemotaxis protein